MEYRPRKKITTILERLNQIHMCYKNAAIGCVGYYMKIIMWGRMILLGDFFWNH